MSRIHTTLVSLCALLMLSCGCTFKQWSTKPAEEVYSLPCATDNANKSAIYFQTFDYSYQGVIGTSTSYGTAINLSNGQTALGTSVTNHSGWVTEDFLTGTLSYTLKSKGYKVNRMSSDLILVGHAYASSIDFSNFWSDLGINALGLITLGSTGSTRYQGGAVIHVYSKDGQELTYYSDEQSWNYRCLGTPLSTLFNNECYSSSARKRAATLSSMNCLRSFLSDLNKGRFDNTSSPE